MNASNLIIRIAFLSSVFLFSITLGSQATKQDLSLSEAWCSFQRAPSSENAFNLYQSLPDNLDSARNVYLSQSKILQSIYDNFEVLAHQVLAEDRNSIKVAFRLLAVSDGDFAETIDIVLGRLIKTNPRMFLQELKAHRMLVKRLDSLLGNLGEEYIDRFSAVKIELTARINAFQAINDKDLLTIREECIAVLKNIRE